MSRDADQRIGKLLDAGERKRRLVHADTRADAAKLQRLRAKGALVSPHHGLYVRTSAWAALTEPERAFWKMRALCARHPGWVFCDVSAALAHGLSVPLREVGTLHVLSSPGSPTRSTGAIVRHATSARGACWKDGVHVTDLAQSVYDCLRRLGFRDGLAVADSGMAAMELDDWETLADRLIALHHGEPGLRRTLGILRHADPRAESGGESIARAAMLELGFELPELQVEVPDPFAPGRSYRVDFLWTLPDGNRVAGELDGREKYVNPQMTKGRSAVEVLAEERLRESRLSAAGVRVMRFSFADVCRLGFFESLLERYGIPRPGRPSRLRSPFREEWRPMELGGWRLRCKRVWPRSRLAREPEGGR